MSEENKDLKKAKKKIETIKKMSKDNAEVGGLSIGFIIAKILEMNGIPLNSEELLLIGGLFTGAGARIKDFFKD